jgi:hypothetical protein
VDDGLEVRREAPLPEERDEPPAAGPRDQPGERFDPGEVAGNRGFTTPAEQRPGILALDPGERVLEGDGQRFAVVVVPVELQPTGHRGLGGHTAGAEDAAGLGGDVLGGKPAMQVVRALGERRQLFAPIAGAFGRRGGRHGHRGETVARHGVNR